MRSAVLLLLAVLVQFSFSASILAQPVARQVLVKVRVGGQAQRQGSLLLPAGARLGASLPLPGWQRVELPEDMPLRRGLEWFRRRPEVLAVEPNYQYSIHAAPDDPQRDRLFGLDQIGAPTAWETTQGNPAVVAAILDTGIDTSHPDLADNLWTNPAETPGNGIDDDANGWVDDVHGVDTVEGDGDPMDDSGHGTHVAGTVGAVGNNGRGVVGVNWNVRLMGVRIGRADGFGTSEEIVRGFAYVIAMKQRGENVRVINCSWGGAFPSLAIKEAVCAAGDAGILIVCSAGNEQRDNDSLPIYPAGYDCPAVLSVAASTACDDPASFSNFGLTTVDLAAPGSGILSTYRGGERYAVLSGTSMASPHVAGAAALLVAHRPMLTVGDLRRLLLGTVDPVPAWRNLTVTGGRLNLARAMAAAGSGTIPVEPDGGVPETTGHIVPVSRHPTTARWGNDSSSEAAVSPDGRWIAFASNATNLVAGDVEGYRDIFLKDTLLNTLVRVSQTPGGNGARGDCAAPVVSADGQWVAFVSSAANLAANDGNGTTDVFLWDRVTQNLELISVRSDGRNAGSGPSESPAISADGRIVAFASTASNLVGSDSNGASDVFVRDRQRGVTERVSVTPTGGQVQGWSEAPSMSADGRYVAFHSSGGTLAPPDTNQAWDVFLRDRTGRVTELVSAAPSNRLQGNSDSVFPVLGADGRFVAFQSFADNLDGKRSDDLAAVFVLDREERTLVRISDPGAGRASSGDSFPESISADGRWFAFTSDDAQLVFGGQPGLFRPILWDRLTGVRSPIALSNTGEGPQDNSFEARLSGDGGKVVFSSFDFRLAAGDGNAVSDVFVLNRGVERPDLAIRLAGAEAFAGLGVVLPRWPQRAGASIAPGEAADFDIQLMNGSPAASFLVRVSSASDPGWSIRLREIGSDQDLSGAVMGAGWTTPPLAAGSNLLLRLTIERTSGVVAEDVFSVRLTARGPGSDADLDGVSAVANSASVGRGLQMVSRGLNGIPANRTAEALAVSQDGSRLVFSTEAENLDSRGDFNLSSDVFLFERATRTVTRASRGTGSASEGNADSRFPSISGDGQLVAFQSWASNLVPFDRNEVEDIFIRDFAGGTLGRVSLSSAGTEANRGSEGAFLAAGGRYVAFTSLAGNLVPGDDNGADDVFVRDLQTGTVECVSRGPTGAFGDGGSGGAVLSADGRFVLFTSMAENLGPTDENRFADLYLRDRVTGQTHLISANDDGIAANGPSGGGSISDDGRWVTFFSYATDLAPGRGGRDRESYVVDRQDGTRRFLSETLPPLPGGLIARGALVSPDGNWLAVAASADCGMAPGISQVMVVHRWSGRVKAVSALRDGSWGDGHSFVGHFSGDGRYLAFESVARNLLGEDAWPAGQAYLASIAEAGVDALARGDGAWRGEGPGALAEQSVSRVTPVGGTDTAEFTIRLENRGETEDRLRLQATLVGADLLQLRVETTDTSTIEITGDVLEPGTGWTTPVLGFDGFVEVRILASFTEAARLATEDPTMILSVTSSTDPTKVDAVRVILRPDGDGDGLPDVWERQWFGQLEPAGWETDADGDGAADGEEWQAGTDPTRQDDQLRLTLSLPADDVVVLGWNGRSGILYGVQHAVGLAPGSGFETVSPQPIPGSDSAVSFKFQRSPGSHNGFFRIRAERP